MFTVFLPDIMLINDKFHGSTSFVDKHTTLRRLLVTVHGLPSSNPNASLQSEFSINSYSYFIIMIFAVSWQEVLLPLLQAF